MMMMMMMMTASAEIKTSRTSLETLAYSLRAFRRGQGPNNQRRKCQQPTTKASTPSPCRPRCTGHIFNATKHGRCERL